MKYLLVHVGWLLVIGVSWLPGYATARVFKFADENIGTYFKADYTPSTLATKLYSLSSGSNTVFSEPGVDYHLAFEIGFMYTYRLMTLRLGVETVRSKPLTGISGTNSSDTELMTIDSSAVTIAPALHLDLNLYQGDVSRMYIGIGISQVTLTATNDYTFTAAGLAALPPGLADYREQIQGQYFGGIATLGFEFLFTDTTTMSIEFGYRTLNGLPLTHQVAIPKNVDGNAISVGDAATNSDTTQRSVNMTGPFIGIAYRFYVDII